MTPCIEHKQKGGAYGYGTARLPKEFGRVTTSAHRWAYCKAHDKTLDQLGTLDVMHTCHNTRCINPDHLEVGTRSTNQLDAHANGTGYSYFRDGKKPRKDKS